jgi:hypothetical protein
MKKYISKIGKVIQKIGAGFNSRIWLLFSFSITMGVEGMCVAVEKYKTLKFYITFDILKTLKSLKFAA